MNKLMMAGIVVALLGMLGFAIPMFTTEQTKDVANIGDLKLQTTETTPHIVSPMLAGSVLIVGIGLIAIGVTQRRSIS